jgi:hypothetical protein
LSTSGLGSRHTHIQTQTLTHSSRDGEPATASGSHAAQVDVPCAAAAAPWASRREARDDVQRGVEDPEEQRASGDVRKECSICRETKHESGFSRKQWAARAHSRKCSQCAGTARCSGGTPVPIPSPTSFCNSFYM